MIAGVTFVHYVCPCWRVWVWPSVQTERGR